MQAPFKKNKIKLLAEQRHTKTIHMATKPKDSSSTSSSVVGKEKKAPSSSTSSSMTSTKRTTTKPSSTTEKGTPNNPSQKQVPNYLKPTISSRLECPSSFKLPRSSDGPNNNKPNLNRRRSFDKPPSPSRLPKQTHNPSLSRQHKALVSPGPRDRTLHRSTTLPVKTTFPSSKPIISERTSKTPKEGKTTQPLVITKSATKKSSTGVVKNKVASDHDDNASKNAATRSNDNINVESEPVEVKEAVNEEKNDDIGEVEKVENIQEHDEVDQNVSDEIPPSPPQHHVDSEPEQSHGHDQNLDESEQPQHIQGDNEIEKVINTTVSEKEKEEEEAKQEQIKDGDEEDENKSQEECNNINNGDGNSDHQEINHSTTDEGEVLEVKEKDEEKLEEQEEDGIIIEEDHQSETNNEEEIKEGVEGGTSEGQEEEEEHEVQVECSEVVKEEEEESIKGESSSTKGKQQEGGGGAGHGRKESLSNDVIEETASKLLEARKNKVRALAGAFQTVIDHQTK